MPQGAVYPKPVSALDLGGTVVALSGAEVPEGKPLDGVNLIPYLTGENKGEPHEAIYLRQFDRNRFAVRQGNEKILIPWKGGKAQLYDLRKDPGESTDLADRFPDKVEHLKHLRIQWNRQLREPTFLGLLHLPNRKKKP